MKAKNITKKQVSTGATAVTMPEDSVYALMGKNMFPYKEKTVEDYRASLLDLNFSDLQRHAIEIANIIPNTNKREQLIDKLEREYLHKQFQFVNRSNQNKFDKMSDAEEKSINTLLSRGR